jgi:hypothetical protein
MRHHDSRTRLGVHLAIAGLLVLGSAALVTAAPNYTGFDFDVTVDYSPGGSYTYTYDVEITDTLSSAISAFWLDGAYGVDLATISHTDSSKYTWLPGEVLEPGEKPSWDVNPLSPGVYKFENTGPDPAIVWGQESMGSDSLAPGFAGTFSFHSSEAPHNARTWYVSGCGQDYDTGPTVGPSPEPVSGLLLLLGLPAALAARKRRQD